jgi:hypothetical protein
MMVGQILLDAHEEELVTFCKCIPKLRRKHEYLSRQEGKSVQTLVFFDMLESMTVNSAGKKIVETGTVGSEKQCCTIMLAVTVDGQKLILS